MAAAPRKPPPGRRRRAEAETLNEVLDDIIYKLDNDDTPSNLTLGEVLDSVGRRSYGPLLVIIGLVAVSPLTALPGTTWFVAALTLIVAGQMALGLRRTWLPRKALEMRIPREKLHKGVDAFRPWARRIDTLLKPRLTFLSRPPFVNLVALLVVAAALITFPLGLIPLAPIAPGLAVVFFGLGMVAKDGLWLSLGTAVVLGALWLAKPLIL